jgi:hypothetical protein
MDLPLAGVWRRDRPVSPVMTMPASDPVKMRAARDWVVAAIVTSAGAGGRLAVTDHWAPLLSAR